jgi:hypothetical protein
MPVRTGSENHVGRYSTSNSSSSSSDETSYADNSQIHANADSEDASDAEHRDYRRLNTERRVTSQGREGRSDGFKDRCPSEGREATEARVRTNKSTEVKQITTDRCSSGSCTENEYRRRIICRCMEQKDNRDATRAKAARVQLDLRRTHVVFLVMRQVNMVVAQATTVVILAMSTIHESSGDTGQRMIIQDANSCEIRAISRRYLS